MSIKKIKIKTLLLKAGFLSAIFGVASFALADLKNPLKATSFADLVKNVAEIVAAIGVPIAVIFIIWSGFLFVTARGSEDQIKKAKTTFFWTIIGTTVLLGSWALATAISEFIQGL